MTRGALLLCLLLSTPGAVVAQGLRGKISELFIFGSGEEALFLAGTADPDNPVAIQAHSDHFVPSAVGSNATLIGFLTNAVGTSIAAIPISATSSGTTFRFEGGVPVQTSTSPGPIIGERAQTLGRGRVFVGASVTELNFKSLRGVDLEHLRLNFTHVNADFPGCDTIFGGDCTQQGIPQLENDFIELELALDLDVRATTFQVTYGLLDRVDIGVAIPIVSTSLRGQSNAQVVPFGGPTAAHFFSGTPEDPNLFASRSVEGSSSGLGDIAARLKVGVSESQSARFAILADARFATGSAQDLLGSGHFAMRGLGIVSADFGGFASHANVGYLYRRGADQNDAVLATVGFDQVLAPWATLAMDLVSELQVGDSKLTLPDPLTIEAPFHRVIEPTTVPTMRDDIVNASVGFKFTASSGLTIVTNSIWPLNKGGLRPDVMWTAGLEYSF
jgi:hypothetical protein